MQKKSPRIEFQETSSKCPLESQAPGELNAVSIPEDLSPVKPHIRWREKG